MSPAALERVLLRDALAYLELRTGLAIERRTALRWMEAGRLQVNDQIIVITSTKISRRWYLTRDSLNRIVVALSQ